MNRQQIQQVLNQTPVIGRSTDDAAGNPRVHPLMEWGDGTLWIHPRKVMVRDGPGFEEVDGLAWQWRGPEGWRDRLQSGSFEHLAGLMDLFRQEGAVYLDPEAHNDKAMRQSAPLFSEAAEVNLWDELVPELEGMSF